MNRQLFISTFIIYIPDQVADVLTKRTRSKVMAAIRSKGNKATELKLVFILRSAGIRGWRRHPPLPGNPDFIFRAQRLVIFVDGCFWHGCRWHCRLPLSRIQYWGPKITANFARDIAINRTLRARGWRVLRIWEHSLKQPEKVCTRLKAALASCNNTD